MAGFFKFFQQLNVKVAVLLLLSLYLKNATAQQSIDPELQSKIDDFIQNTYLPASGISTLGLSIVQNNGQLLYTTGYGLANQEKNIPATNSTQFLIASITKSFTSVVAIKLLHEKFPDLGQGVMDTPIRQLLPDISFTLNDRYSSEQATFRDLLAHRLCYPAENAQIYADPFDTAEELFYRARYAEPVCGIRARLEYNNQFYAVAGELLGILAGKSYEELVQDLLNELGMSNSALAHRSDDFDQIPNRSLPYYLLNGQLHPYNRDMSTRIELSNPAGGLFSTPDDMAKYIQFLLNQGSVDGRQIIAPEVMQWLINPSNEFPGLAFKKAETDLIINQFGYGLGFVLSAYDGWQMVQHSGGLAPYISLVSFFPAKNLGVFTTTNQAPDLLNQAIIHAFIFETLKGNPNAVESAMKVKSQLEKQKAAEMKKSEKEFNDNLNSLIGHGKRRHVAADIVGEYGNGNLGQLVVSEKLNENTGRVEMYLDYGKWYKGWLEDVYGNIIFEIHWETDVPHDDYAMGGQAGLHFLVLNTDGNVVLMQSIGGVGGLQQTGMFYPGVSRDTLPTIPWSPDSCGPEKEYTH